MCELLYNIAKSLATEPKQQPKLQLSLKNPSGLSSFRSGCMLYSLDIGLHIAACGPNLRVKATCQTRSKVVGSLSFPLGCSGLTIILNYIVNVHNIITSLTAVS